MKTLKFTRNHRHAGIGYVAGQTETFSDRAADQILASQSAEEITPSAADALPPTPNDEASPRAGKGAPK